MHVCVIGGWSEKTSNYCCGFLFSVIMTPTQKPSDSPIASRLTQPPPTRLIGITEQANQTTGLILVHLILLFVMMSLNTGPLDITHCGRELLLPAGCIYHWLIWPFNFTCHTKQAKKLNKASYGCKDSSDDVRYYSWMMRATTALTASSFKQKILTISSYFMKHGIKQRFLLFWGKETWWEGKCWQAGINMIRKEVNYTVRWGR